MISKSYTFTNGTTIDPDEVNQNFDDVLDEIKGAHHSDVDGTLILPADINASWGLVPIGGIILWSGLISTIPAGYSFCNGAGGTVDMRNKFAICPGQDSGGTYDTADTGGSATHTLTTAQMPTHTHIQTAHTHIQNGHNHSTSYQTDGENSPLGGNYNIVTDYRVPTGAGNKITIGNTTPTNQNTTPTNQNAGSGSAHNNVQPGQVSNFIIKY